VTLLLAALWIVAATIVGIGVASLMYCCVKVIRGVRTVSGERKWADSAYRFKQAKIDIAFGGILIPLSLVMILIGLVPFFLGMP